MNAEEKGSLKREEAMLLGPVRFPQGTRVKHLKSGGVYEILETPEKVRIEAMNAPAYLYSDGTFHWVRPQSEMEDGRFEKLVSAEKSGKR